MNASEAITILETAIDAFASRQDWRAVDEGDALLRVCYEAEASDYCAPEFVAQVRGYAWAAN